MKHLRKWGLALLCAAIMALSLCSCSREDGQIDGNGDAMSESSAATTQSTTTTSSTSATTDDNILTPDMSNDGNLLTPDTSATN